MKKDKQDNLSVIDRIGARARLRPICRRLSWLSWLIVEHPGIASVGPAMCSLLVLRICGIDNGVDCGIVGLLMA